MKMYYTLSVFDEASGKKIPLMHGTNAEKIEDWFEKTAEKRKKLYKGYKVDADGETVYCIDEREVEE